MTDTRDLITRIDLLERSLAQLQRESKRPALLDEIGDVTASSAMDGASLTFDASIRRWRPGSPGPSSSAEVFVGSPAPGAAAGKDKARVETAIAIAEALPRGATVRFGSGFYDAGDLAITLPQDANKSVNLQGAGFRATELKFSTDSGLGTYAIAGVGTGGTCYNRISDMKITGPGAATAYGTSPALMDGIRSQGGMVLEQLEIRGFRSGIVDTGDHITYRNVTSTGNFYGVYFAEGVTRDDILFDNCNLTDNTWASINIASGSSNFMGGVTFLRGHLGYGPFGIYIEDCPLYEVKIANVQFLGTSWEAIGNGAIFSVNQKASTANVMMDNCRPFSINNAIYGVPSSTAPYMVYVARMAGWTIRNSGLTGFGSLPTIAMISTLFIDTPLIWDEWLGTFLDCRAGGKAFILCPGPSGGVFLRSGGGGGTESRFEHARAIHSSGGTIAIGDLMERADGGAVARNSGNTVPFGIAMNTVTVTNELIVVAQRADAVTVNTVESAVAANDLLVPDSTTPYKVKKVALGSLAATQPVVGKPQAAVGTVSGGQILATVAL